MQNTIQLTCGVEDCNQVYKYELSLNNPIALEAEWKALGEQAEVQLMLSSMPQVGLEYEICISTPVEINLSENFWILYLPPSACLNGFESEEDILNLRFCLCSFVKTLAKENCQIRIIVKVIDTIPALECIGEQSAKKECLDIVSNFEIGEYYFVKNYLECSLVDINIQSDLGWEFIISRIDGKYKIVAWHSWDFHHNIWRKTNIELDEFEFKCYMLKSI